MTWISRARRPLVAGLLAMTLVGVGAACGGGSGDGDQDQTLRVGVPIRMLSVDPHGTAISDRSTLTLALHLFDPLVASDGGEITGRLAESWENVNDTTTRFTLRQGVTFHDGSPLTSADVKASLDRLFAASTALAPLFATIEEVKAPDEQTVEIITSRATGSLLTNLSMAYIGSKAQIESGEIESRPVGTGAFKLEDFRSGERAHMVANESYWDGAPKYERLEFQEISEDAARLTALRTGEIDVTYSLPPDQLSQVRGFDDVTVESGPSATFYVIWLNNARKPLDDPKVRQALWHAVDFSSIQENLFGESAVLAQAPVPQPVFGAAQLPGYTYDPQRARQLLAEAGYPNGFSTSIQWSANCCANIRPLVQSILSAWKEVGVNVEMQEKEAGQWLDDLLALDWDMNIQDGVVVTQDAEFVLGRLYTCAAKRLGYCNEEYDRVIADASEELDPQERQRKLQRAQEILWADAPGAWPFELTASAAWRDRVSGFGPPPTNVPDFRGVSLN
ncbi:MULTISPECIES: ABC transporter substrate-binding protein [unclassified Micromonospora]|uniref:ABC transporter substrate-binding protein n=1 Tax=Micromonospora sp. NPDC049903 TaxID=3364276 RepID=UPI00379380AD